MTLTLTFNEADPEDAKLFWDIADLSEAEGFLDSAGLVKNMLWQKFGNKKKKR